MEETTVMQGYALIRLDGLKDMLVDQGKMLEKILSTQEKLLKAVEASDSGRLTKWLKYWPQIVGAGASHILTVITVGAMIRQGADATSVLDFIGKQF